MNMLYPLIAILIWSVNSVVIKLSAGVIEPASISFYRCFGAFILLSPFLLKPTLHQLSEVKKNLGKFFVLGCLGMCLYQALAFFAASSTTASLIGISNGIVPILTMLLSLFILRTPPTIGIILGGFLSLFGLIFIISHGHPTALLNDGIGKGELLLFAAALSYALYGVLLKRWTIPVTKGVSLYIQIFFGTLCLVPTFIMQQGSSDINTGNIAIVLYSAVLASIVAPFVWMQGIARLGANKCAIFLNLAPVITAIIAYYYLEEDLGWSFVIGTTLVLIGILMAQFMTQPRR